MFNIVLISCILDYTSICADSNDSWWPEEMQWFQTKSNFKTWKKFCNVSDCGQFNNLDVGDSRSQNSWIYYWKKSFLWERFLGYPKPFVDSPDSFLPISFFSGFGRYLGLCIPAKHTPLKMNYNFLCTFINWSCE